MVSALVSLALAWPCGAGPDRALPPLRFAAPRAADKAACVDPAQAAARYDGAGELTATLRTEHFEIAYDPDAEIVSDAYLDTLADALETIWATEVDELGWPAPEGSDAYFVQVIVTNLPADAPYGGVASIADCEGQSVGYFLLNTDFWYRSPDYILDVAAHEFHHLSQYASEVSYADDDSQWFYEASAVWMEDRVFEDTDTYASDFLPQYLADPQTGLTAFEYATGMQYAHFVWPLYVDEHAGGNELLRDLWASGEPPVLDAFDARFADTGGMAGQWAGFLARAAAFDFSDGDVFADALATSGAAYFSVDADVPASGESPADPERYGAAYLHLRAPAGEGIRFTLSGDPDDGWVAGAGDVTAVAADGELTLELASSEAWIGVGPTARNARAWSWAAEAIPATTEEPPETKAGCGCESGSPAGVGWAVALLALGLAARKPR